MNAATSGTFDAAAALAEARPDGRIVSVAPLLLPFMAPRLQGECRPDGRLDLALWGAGNLASIRFEGWSGPYVFAPNHVEARGGGLHVARSAPVLVLRGARLLSLSPARRCASWDTAGGGTSTRSCEGILRASLPWGVVLVEARGDDIVVAAGENEDEAHSGLATTVSAIVAQSSAYIESCDRMADADPSMRSMIQQGVHAFLSSVRRDSAGAFAGLAAGQAYSAPARTYYRDGYWTLQGLLPLEPEAVAGQIELLAKGMHSDGEAPSGVILTGPAQSQAWERVRGQRVYEQHLRPGDWWSDHFDSPLFFVLTLRDYVEATGDDGPLRRHWPLVAAVIRRYRDFARQGDGLPLKPRNDRDWADNVFREGHVAYDIGLWIGALDAVARLGAAIDPDLARTAAGLAAAGRASLDDALLQPSGWYADWSVPGGFAEDHLTLDSLTLLRHDAVDDARARIVLDAVGRELETRRNARQPYGDWGVMCVYPPFKRRGDARAKSAFAFRYHNGSDWPYLDGLYAGELLRRGMDGWRYPLLRWWRTCLERGWIGAVEYFAPPFGRGSLLQGWSGLPAAVALRHERAVKAARYGRDFP